MPTLTNQVLYYLICRICLQKWASMRDRERCPFCGEDASRVRGIKVEIEPIRIDHPELN